MQTPSSPQSTRGRKRSPGERLRGRNLRGVCVTSGTLPAGIYVRLLLFSLLLTVCSSSFYVIRVIFSCVDSLFYWSLDYLYFLFIYLFFFYIFSCTVVYFFVKFVLIFLFLSLFLFVEGSSSLTNNDNKDDNHRDHDDDDDGDDNGDEADEANGGE